MKKLILILSLTISMTTTHSQAVLEHVYINQSVGNPIKLSNNEWIYAVLPYNSFPPTDVKIFSSSHVLLKTIPFYIPSGHRFSSLLNVSDVLFNSDNKIELLYSILSNIGDSCTLYLINEDEMILQEFPHQYWAWVYNIDGDYKLQTLNDQYDSSCRIYSLPGTMVDVPHQNTQIELSASPNPCKDLIEISHPINAVRIRIISVEGKEVYRVNTGMALSTKVQTMSFPTGIYIFEVTLSDQRKLTGKFIKR